MTTQANALNVKVGNTVIFLVDEWRNGEKSDFDGSVTSVTDTGVDVCYLSGFRSRNDFIPWSDVLAKLDKRRAWVKVPDTCYSGHFLLAEKAA